MLALLLLASFASNAHANDSQRIDRYIADYTKTNVQLGLGGEMDVPYQKQITNLLQSKNLPQQTRFFNRLKAQGAALKKSRGRHSHSAPQLVAKPCNCNRLILRSTSIKKNWR